jgi:hypothetical protein
MVSCKSSEGSSKTQDPDQQRYRDARLIFYVIQFGQYPIWSLHCKLAPKRDDTFTSQARLHFTSELHRAYKWWRDVMTPKQPSTQHLICRLGDVCLGWWVTQSRIPDNSRPHETAQHEISSVQRAAQASQFLWVLYIPGTVPTPNRRMSLAVTHLQGAASTLLKERSKRKMGVRKFKVIDRWFISS